MAGSRLLEEKGMGGRDRNGRGVRRGTGMGGSEGRVRNGRGVRGGTGMGGE